MIDYLNVQMTINFKIHKYSFMNEEKGIFGNATDKELCEYIRDNFECNVQTVDGDAISSTLIIPENLS